MTGGGGGFGQKRHPNYIIFGKILEKIVIIAFAMLLYGQQCNYVVSFCV